MYFLVNRFQILAPLPRTVVKKIVNIDFHAVYIDFHAVLAPPDEIMNL